MPFICKGFTSRDYPQIDITYGYVIHKSFEFPAKITIITVIYI